MAEQNDLNNDNPQPYNNKQQSKYQHLFLSEQLIQNQSNVEPLMQPSQLYCTPQINYDNNYQTKPQNNNITSLNNETISRKRKMQLINAKPLRRYSPHSTRNMRNSRWKKTRLCS